MTTRTRLLLCILTLTAIVLCITPLALLAAESERAPAPFAVVREKALPTLPATARQFLLARDNESARIWVFFTDKEVFDRRQFDALAQSVRLGQKSSARRAKVGMDRVTFADLPVSSRYVDGIIDAGATLRRQSKWLNAASFDVPHERLDAIAALPYVASIRPVAGSSQRRPESQTLDRQPSPEQSQAPDALDYGESITQLGLIDVPELHEEGYDGTGVTLAIFDTGFRTDHEAFAAHYSDGRVLAEYDFIFDDDNVNNEAADIDKQWDHGTETWSIAGGLKDGRIYGPAYKANFLLAKTEDERSETQVEEDNWVAALEWADSLGADVVTSSVGYDDWYTYEDMDGETAVTTLAANRADSIGIIVCQSMGNSGPAEGTLVAPADAFDILAVGSVNAAGVIAYSSSRGPTYDGRIKPEVCAQGVMVFMAKTDTDSNYGYGNGTSFSTPAVAGVACLLIQAHPDYTPEMIRNSLKETASRADTPDNTYGWGIIDADAAHDWGVSFEADTYQGTAPLTVQFSDLSPITPSSWHWQFGDGSESFEQNPEHEYTQTGSFDVTLTIDSDYGQLSKTWESCVVALGDTLSFSSDSVYAGQPVMVSISLTNSQLLREIILPFEADIAPLALTFDSITRGARTDYFDRLSYLYWEPDSMRFTVRLVADTTGSTPPLDPGSGEILRLYCTTNPWDGGGLVDAVDTSLKTPQLTELVSPNIHYIPVVHPGEIRSITVMCGDLNYDFNITLSDISKLIDYLYISKTPPNSLWSADVNGSQKVTLSDVSVLIDHLYISKAPIDCLPDE